MYVEDVTGALKIKHVRALLERDLKSHNATFLGDFEVVRVPDIPGRIRKIPHDSNPENFSVEYIVDRWYDEKAKQSRNKKCIIGEIYHLYPIALYPNENYYKYFDIVTGNPKELPERKKKETEEPKQEQEKKETEEEAPANEADNRTGKAPEEPETKKEEDKAQGDINELIRLAREAIDIQREKSKEEERRREMTQETGQPEYDEPENETLQEAYRQYQFEKERKRILKYLLEDILDSIHDQAKKRPNDIVNEYKANRINDLLREIISKYQDSGYEDLMRLVELPHEEEKDGVTVTKGMTYSDVEILLAHYRAVMSFGPSLY